MESKLSDSTRLAIWPIKILVDDEIMHLMLKNHALISSANHLYLYTYHELKWLCPGRPDFIWVASKESYDSGIFLTYADLQSCPSLYDTMY